MAPDKFRPEKTGYASYVASDNSAPAKTFSFTS